MSKVLCERKNLVAIAGSVRGKTGNTKQMTLGEVKTGIDNFSSGDSGDGNTNIKTCTVIIKCPQTYWFYSCTAGVIATATLNSYSD